MARISISVYSHSIVVTFAIESRCTGDNIGLQVRGACLRSLAVRRKFALGWLRYLCHTNGDFRISLQLTSQTPSGRQVRWVWCVLRWTRLLSSKKRVRSVGCLSAWARCPFFLGDAELLILGRIPATGWRGYWLFNTRFRGHGCSTHLIQQNKPITFSFFFFY